MRRKLRLVAVRKPKNRKRARQDRAQIQSRAERRCGAKADQKISKRVRAFRLWAARGRGGGTARATRELAAQRANASRAK